MRAHDRRFVVSAVGAQRMKIQFFNVHTMIRWNSHLTTEIQLKNSVRIEFPTFMGRRVPIAHGDPHATPFRTPRTQITTIRTDGSIFKHSRTRNETIQNHEHLLVAPEILIAVCKRYFTMTSPIAARKVNPHYEQWITKNFECAWLSVIGCDRNNWIKCQNEFAWGNSDLHLVNLWKLMESNEWTSVTRPFNLGFCAKSGNHDVLFVAFPKQANMTSHGDVCLDDADFLSCRWWGYHDLLSLIGDPSFTTWSRLLMIYKAFNWEGF